MYIMVNRGSLSAVIRKVGFLPRRKGKCKLDDVAAELALRARSGKIPVCSRNEWRRSLHGGQAGSSGFHA